MNIWIKYALKPEIVGRAIKTSMIVGTLLVCINYGSTLSDLTILMSSWWKILLTYCVPYAVSTYSAVASLLSKSTN